MQGVCADCDHDGKLHAHGRRQPCYWRAKHDAAKEICPGCGRRERLRPIASGPRCWRCVRREAPRKQPTPSAARPAQLRRARGLPPSPKPVGTAARTGPTADVGKPANIATGDSVIVLPAGVVLEQLTDCIASSRRRPGLRFLGRVAHARYRLSGTIPLRRHAHPTDLSVLTSQQRLPRCWQSGSS